MADPLSAAGTAVGIVSLGLQVSQGLIKYYSHFKAHDEEIADTVSRAEALQGLLKSLEGPLRKAEIEPGDISTHVRNAVNACETRLLRLSVAVQKYGTLEIPATREEKLRALRKKALYPFKRGTLQELNAILEELTMNLQLALQMLNLETTQSLKRDIAQATSYIDLDLMTQLDRLSKKLDQQTLTIQAFQSHSHLYGESALLNSMCQEQENFRRDTMTCLQDKPRRKKSSCPRRSPVCSCPYQSQNTGTRFHFYGLSSYWTRTTRHLPQCPQSRYAQRVDTLGAKYIYCTRILGFSIAAALSVTRGAGGLSISPHLMLRAVVPKDSLAFRLLDPVRSEADGGGKFSSPHDHVNWILQQLNRLFQEGKASPTDITSDGKTMLVYAIEQMQYWLHVYRSPELKSIQATSHLVDGLLSAGVDPLELHYPHRTPIDTAINTLSCKLAERPSTFQMVDCHDLLVKLFDCGLAIEGANSFLDPYYASSAASIIQNTMKRMSPEEKIGTLEVPDILEAIYRQDNIALEKAISRFPESINEQDRTGLTALHLSISWPEGLLILLARGAEPAVLDSLGNTPLKVACYFPRATHDTSALILLDYNSPLGNLRQNYNLENICKSKNLALRDKFIFHLINKRKLLLDLALESLLTWQFERSRLKDDRILDAQAADVYSALLQYDISIDPVLLPSVRPGRTTVYHSKYLDVSTANILFEAGFRDIDETDNDELTPFWMQVFDLRDEFDLRCDSNLSKDFETLEILQWLRDKNVDVYHRHPEGGGTAMHALGAAIGHNLSRAHRKCYNTKLPTVQQAKIAWSFLKDAVADDCQCACSTNGCRITTSAFKEARFWYSCTRLRTGENQWEDLRLSICISIIESVMPKGPWISLEVIRIMTFEWLTLTHTCHKDPLDELNGCREPLSREEIHRIQDEERFMIQEHEELVAEFEAKYTELGLTLTHFLKVYWKPRMEEVLQDDAVKRAEEEVEMRKFGIIVDERDRVEAVESDKEEDGLEVEADDKDSGSED